MVVSYLRATLSRNAGADPGGGGHKRLALSPFFQITFEIDREI
jgi:hypothetical protein